MYQFLVFLTNKQIFYYVQHLRIYFYFENILTTIFNYVISSLQAYHRQQPATAVQVARIAAITIVVVTFTMGIFMLASSYVQANATCAHLQQELMLLQEAAERFQPPEALVQVKYK